MNYCNKSMWESTTVLILIVMMVVFFKIWLIKHSMYGFFYCDKIEWNGLVFGEQFTWLLAGHTCN